MKYFNDYFEQNFDYKDGLIDIYDESLTYDRLVCELHKIRHICDRCLFISKEDAVSKKWQQSKQRDMSEYVYIGEK